MDQTLSAIDPATCGCTDCIVGYSIPAGQATQKQLRRMVKGQLQDRTSTPYIITFKW
jgi:hypothetical protein